MTKYHGDPRFYKELEKLSEIHSKKNHDYAGEDPLSNFKESEKMGIPAWKGVLVRMTDKMSRLQTFAKKGKLEVSDENVEDTLRDMAIYAILGLLLYRDDEKDDIVFMDDAYDPSKFTVRDAP